MTKPIRHIKVTLICVLHVGDDVRKASKAVDAIMAAAEANGAENASLAAQASLCHCPGEKER